MFSLKSYPTILLKFKQYSKNIYTFLSIFLKIRWNYFTIFLNFNKINFKFLRNFSKISIRLPMVVYLLHTRRSYSRVLFVVFGLILTKTYIIYSGYNHNYWKQNIKNRTMKQSEITVSRITLSFPGEKSQNINKNLSCVVLPHTSLNGNYLNVTVCQMVKHMSKLNGTLS